MHLDRRQSVKCFSYRQISQFQRFLDRLAFSKLCCHTAGSDSRTAAKSLETDIGNDIVFDFNKNLHDIAAFGIAYLADAVGIDRYTIVCAYNWGQYAMLYLAPTGLVMATLQMLDMKYQHWLKFVTPMVIFLLVFGSGMLIAQTLV